MMMMMMMMMFPRIYTLKLHSPSSSVEVLQKLLGAHETDVSCANSAPPTYTVSQDEGRKDDRGRVYRQASLFSVGSKWLVAGLGWAGKEA